MKVYLDNAATTPMDPEVLEAMLPFMKDNFGNPSSTHSFGRTTKTAIEKARKTIAHHLNCEGSELCFTSGGTEADNMALKCAVRDLGVKRIITSPTEHKAVIESAELLKEKFGVELEYVELDKVGRPVFEDLENRLKRDVPTIVSLMHANNEIGTKIDLTAIGNLCRKYNAYFHSDTVQTMGHYPFDLKELPVDFVTCAGHKFHGPKGIGFLFIRKGIRIKSMIQGGGQERQIRGGTENLYGIVGLAKAMELAYHDLQGHIDHVQGLKNHMRSELKAHYPAINFNGDTSDDGSLYTVLNVCLPETENNKMFLFSLDLKGIAASGGSACSSGASKGSHVLTAIGSSVSCTSVRFSFSRFTTKEEIDYTLATVKELLPVNVNA
jgi:cysteine desulfurase